MQLTWIDINGSNDGKEHGATSVDGNKSGGTNNHGMELVILAIDDCWDGNDDDMLLVNVGQMEFPEVHELLGDPNVWIADTEA